MEDDNSDSVKIFSKDTFYILSIDIGQISHLDWNNPDYVQMLVSLPIISNIFISSINKS